MRFTPFLFLVLLPAFLQAQSNRFSEFYDYDNGASGFLNVLTTEDGFVAQGTNFKNGIRQSHTIAIDSNGSLLSEHSVFDVQVGYESFAMIRLSSGQIVSAGSLCDLSEPSLGPCDFYFARLNEEGDTLSTHVYERRDTSDVVLSMVETRPNKIMLIGWTYNDTTNADADLLFITVDTLGNELNRVVYGGGGTDFIGGGVVIDSTGDVVLAGFTGSFPASSIGRTWVVKTDSLGNVKWQRTYSGVCGVGSSAARICRLVDGNLIIAGGNTAFGGGGFGVDGSLMKIDTAGNLFWAKEYEVEGGQGLWSCSGLADGTIVANGVTDAGDGSQAGWLIKTDANGDTLWTRTFNPSSSTNFLRNMLIMPNGDIVAVGFGRGESSTTQDGWILRVDSMGCEIENCFSVGIEESPFDSAQGTLVEVYPNPVTDVLHVRFANNPVHSSVVITITDMLGRVVLRFTEKGNTALDVTALKSGIYMLRTTDDNGISSSVKFVKE